MKIIEEYGKNGAPAYEVLESNAQARGLSYAEIEVE